MDDFVFQYFGQHLTWSIQNFAAGIGFASDFACRRYSSVYSEFKYNTSNIVL